MAMTDEEVASAAAHRAAGRRRRVTKACEVCGTTFEGLSQRRYCSDRCRVRASRLRRQTRASDEHLPDGARAAAARGQGGDAVIERLNQTRASIGRRGDPEDSTAIIRRSRLERTEELMRAVES